MDAGKFRFKRRISRHCVNLHRSGLSDSLRFARLRSSFMKFSRDNRANLQASDFTVIVTGATGWLGQAALEMLADAFGADFPDRVRAFASSARNLTLRSGRQIACRPLPEIRDLPPGNYLYFHFAFLGKERTAELSLPDYASRVQEITDLMTGAMRRVGNRGILLPSSGAVYRPDHSLDDDLEHNPYGVLKLRDEKLFRQLAEDMGVPITIPRIFNLSGPYINKLGSYALSSILMDVLRDQPVRLQAAHPVIRSYVHVGDVWIWRCFAISRLRKAPGFLTPSAKPRSNSATLRAWLRRSLAGPVTILFALPSCPLPSIGMSGIRRNFGRILDQFGYSIRELPRANCGYRDFLRGTLPAG